MWTSKPVDEGGNYFRLIAIKVTGRDGRAPLDGDVIVDARQDYEQFGSRPEVSMTMNSEGAKNMGSFDQRQCWENQSRSYWTAMSVHSRL